MTGFSASLLVRSETNIDIVNTWTKTLKNHSIKFGFDLKRIRDSLLQDQTYSPRGIISFGNEQTALCVPQAIGANGLATSCASPKVGVGDDVAAFLLDVPYQLGRDVNTYFPRFARVGVFRLCRRQVAGIQEAHGGPRHPLGILPARHACVPRRFLQLQSHQPDTR